MGANAWKDAGYNDQPKFGRRARGWLARMLAEQLPRLTVKSWHDPDGISRLVAWYMQNSLAYVRWENEPAYRGRGFADGAWCLCFKAIKADLGRAISECNAEIKRENFLDDAARFHTLEDWLRADIAGALAYAGARGGSDRISAGARKELPQSRRAREGRLGRRTCACGRVFGLDTNPNVVHCPECQAARRAIPRAQKWRDPGNGLAARGVYFVRGWSGGKDLLSVSARGREVEHVTVKPSEDYRAAVAAMWAKLDRVDPPRKSRGRRRRRTEQQ